MDALGPLPNESRRVERRIGSGPAPAPHKPTSAVPNGLLLPIAAEAKAECRRKGEAVATSLAKVLGKPFYEREGFVLYQRDCREVLRAMATRGIKSALTITSPPYNIGKAYESRLPLRDYVAWCSEWTREVGAATDEKGSFWLNLGYLPVEGRGRAVPIAYLLWDKTPFYLQQEVVWHYGAGVTAKRFFAPRNEKWLFFTKDPDAYVFNLDDVRDPNVKYPNQKKNGKFRCNPLGKNPSDVWAFPKVTTGAKRSSKERTTHPAQFPLKVIDRIVRVSSNNGDLVLDPFSGSGSTGIAAIGNGRPYIGAEVREDYCLSTVDRYERYLKLRDEDSSQEELGTS
jgi:adenine-specific DNA-methyltransferase